MTDPRNSDAGTPRGFAAGARGTNQGGSTTGVGASGAGPGSTNPASTGGAGTMSGAGTTASTGGAGSMEQAKEKAQHLAGQAKEKAGERVQTGLDRGRTRAASTLREVAQSLRQGTGQQQLVGGSPNTGQQFVDRAAQQVQRAADFLENTEVDEMIERVETMARRQPALFLGGAFLLGIVGARFLKSSRRSHGETAVTLYDDRGARRGADAYGGTYGGATRGSYGDAYGRSTGASGSAFLGDRDVTAEQEIATEGIERDASASPSTSTPGQTGIGTGTGTRSGLGGTSSRDSIGGLDPSSRGSIGGLDPDGIDRR